jgi:hypothetical protein
MRTRESSRTDIEGQDNNQSLNFLCENRTTLLDSLQKQIEYFTVKNVLSDTSIMTGKVFFTGVNDLGLDDWADSAPAEYTAHHRPDVTRQKYREAEEKVCRANYCGMGDLNDEWDEE